MCGPLRLSLASKSLGSSGLCSHPCCCLVGLEEDNEEEEDDEPEEGKDETRIFQ
jgi:hypothetical protein